MAGQSVSGCRGSVAFLGTEYICKRFGQTARVFMLPLYLALKQVLSPRPHVGPLFPYFPATLLV